MDISGGVCEAIANVLVVLFLGLVVDRRAITRTVAPLVVAVYAIGLLFGVILSVQGAGDGLDGLAGALTFGAFVFGMAGAGGTLLGLIWSDRHEE